ncbi:hypothetical protein [Burkholderia sp. AU15512]|uniref:hypothetical protein n=1 Tax=Burkholderia sp. AU15512 TaxID=2015345 RepID=UPI00117ED5EB|nr:hypothetical protein [Burkholderia sp. AU15512]
MVLLVVIAALGANVAGAPTDSHLVYRENFAEKVDAARMEDRVDMDKKYADEVDAWLVKSVGTVKVRGFFCKNCG